MPRAISSSHNHPVNIDQVGRPSHQVECTDRFCIAASVPPLVLSQRRKLAISEEGRQGVEAKLAELKVENETLFGGVPGSLDC